MSYKDLLVVLDSDAAARGCIDLAAALAEAFEAHLVALYLVPFPEALRPLGYYDPALLHPLYRELREQARDMADKQHEPDTPVSILLGGHFESTLTNLRSCWPLPSSSATSARTSMSRSG